MKPFLAVASLLTAAVCLAGSAAAAPIRLFVGGSSVAYGLYASQRDSFLSALGDEGLNYSAFDARGDVRLRFRGSTTIENGLTIATGAELRAGGNSNGNAPYIHKWNFDVNSPFGSVKLTSGKAAGNELQIRPEFFFIRVLGGTGNSYAVDKGVKLPYSSSTKRKFKRHFTSIDFISKGTSLAYYTPALSGFTFGASYHPDLSFAANNTIRVPVGKATQDAYSVGAQWKGEVSPGLGLDLSLGYTAKEASKARKKIMDGNVLMGAGGRIRYRGFHLGGTYKWSEGLKKGKNTPRDIDAGTAWEVGLGYQEAPYVVTLNYYTSDAPITAKVGAAKAKKDTVSHVQLTGQYDLSSGVKAEAAIAYVAAEGADYKTATKNKDMLKNSGMVIAAGLSVYF